MVHTYSNDDKIYLVDLMIAYVNIFKYPLSTIDTSDYFDCLHDNCWRKHGKKYSPMDVLKNPTHYEHDMKKIREAELKYPVIMHNGVIVDGMHRLAKAYLQNKTELHAYNFGDTLMKKFLISNSGDYKKLEKFDVHDFIEIFNDRFSK
jgi:hypothetical protein